MLTELHGKAGRVCRQAKDGELRCPLIVRPSSEDVVTGHLATVLQTLNPRWWLPDLLNTGLDSARFRRQVFRKFRIEPWKNYPRYPRELLPWDEGSTQVDLVLTWENPPTTVFIEMKYGSDLSKKTAGHKRRSGYPADQLVRNARVGLLTCGWFRRVHLFDVPPRDFILLLCAPGKGHWLVKKYRESTRLLRAIPHSDKLRGLPTTPFVGEASYQDIIRVLNRQRRWFSAPERRMVDLAVRYLAYKASTVPEPQSVQKQETLYFPGHEARK